MAMRVAGPFGCQCQNIQPCSVSTSRSSNRTGGSPASGSPTRLPCIRPRSVAADRPVECQSVVVFVQTQIGRILRAAPRVGLPLQPPAEPTAGVLLHDLPGAGPIRSTTALKRQSGDSFAFARSTLWSFSTFSGVLRLIINLLAVTPSDTSLEVRSLPSPGITRLHRYYEPLRLPPWPGLSLAGVRLAVQSATTVDLS